MKQIHIAGNLLKSLMLAGLLTACNNDQTIVPAETAGVERNEQNTKLSSLLRLIDDNGTSIQYIKSGKFLGKTSKAIAINDRYEYTYDDNNPAGDLWITRKKYAKSNNALLGQVKYKISNGVCISSEDNVAGDYFEYKYTAQGYLDEIKFSHNGVYKNLYKYSYNFNNATGVYRLTKITLQNAQSATLFEQTFAYTANADNYPTPAKREHIDKYLPFFGKLCDVLPQKVSLQWVDPNALDSEQEFTYTVDGNGLVSTKVTQLSTNNTPSGSITETFKYSANWQGI
ncbi:hypothetical protein GCM10007423_36250 [Dyadobacter endophyticus]|uniref:DUF4595 domain-containing protein n=1 Tax=Dyadobacter endophyticus TaxID=1749036 RepID=A0ABQ1YVY0_9BACT|nr:hypothetical protein [Dyadobacter endophyticus]GGH40867.1 hypothetical protein GCM10007423_36250 [Dyadobacter endophyticus]